MPRKTRRQPEDGEMRTETVFHRADVLYVLEWATLAPGLGGWTVMLDDDAATRVVSVVSPGASQPTFAIHRVRGKAVVTWLRPGTGKAREVDTYPGLRAAVLAICPLGEDQVQSLNESMELLYPRRLRTR